MAKQSAEEIFGRLGIKVGNGLDRGNGVIVSCALATVAVNFTEAVMVAVRCAVNWLDVRSGVNKD